MRSPLLVGGIALLVLVLLVLAQLRHPAQKTATGEDPESASSRAAQTLASSEAPTSEAVSQPSPTSAPQRDALAATPASEPMCRIRVIDAASHAPEPDATVWLQRESVPCDSLPWQQSMERFHDVEGALRDGNARELALDARGEVLVRQPKRWLCVAAARGALHGWSKLQPEDNECVVELKPYHSLVVEVVDRGGRPVDGARVACYWGYPSLYSVTLVAGADGRVSFPKLEDAVNLHDDHLPLRVSLVGGSECEPEFVAFTLDTLPSEPVRLVAGDHGSVVVELTDAQGEGLPLDGECEVDLVWDPALEPSLTQRAGDLEAPIVSGRATFECIALGHALEVQVRAEGHGSEWRSVPGPTEPGQRVIVQVPVGETFVGIRGHVRGLRACFGDTRDYGVRLEGRSTKPRVTFSAFAHEDADFESLVPNVTELEGLATPWTLYLTRPGRPTATATVVPILDARANVVDFGDVVFQPAPVLARVHVRDDSGAPASEASLEIESGAEKGTAACDESGLCVVSASVARLPARVRATRYHYLPSDWAEITAAESEIELELRLGARLDGQLLLPRAAQVESFQIVLHVEPRTPNVAVKDLRAEPAEGGRFCFEPCEPGLASLSIRYRRREVLERTGIVLAGNVELEPIDLRPLLHPYELTFELASGEPWTGGHLELIEPEEKTKLWTDIGASGRATFLAPSTSVDLWVAARGAGVQRFEGVLDGDRLTLPAAPSVRLRLPPDLERPAAPRVLLARGEWNGSEEPEFETYDDLDVDAAVVGEDGSAWLRMPRPGPYQLHWIVRHTGTGFEVDVEQHEPQVIDVRATPETGDVPTVEVRLTREELERALAETGR